ncbi:MAG: hypothetical protein ACE5PV_19210 [Candidatus Poribacteria bacterium]
MGILISVTMAILAVAVVFYPLFRNRQSEPNWEAESALEDLIAQKDEVYTAIKDLEFDYMADKLTDEDYHELREKYETEAILILQQIEEFGLVENGKLIESYELPEDLVEAEIQRFKEWKSERKAKE